jgi:hypothetical protein
MEGCPVRLKEEKARVMIALGSGYVGGGFTLAFYCTLAIFFFSQGTLLQSGAFLMVLGLGVILGLIFGLVAFWLTKGYQCVDVSLEKKRRLAFQLGILDAFLTGWVVLGAIISLLFLPPS